MSPASVGCAVIWLKKIASKVWGRGGSQAPAEDGIQAGNSTIGTRLRSKRRRWVEMLSASAPIINPPVATEVFDC